jgi:hypothetical protein
MTMADRTDIRKGDVGLDIEVILMDGDSAVNVSSMTTRTLKLKKPSGAVTTHAMSFVTDGSDGRLKYPTVTGDINEAGTWQLQVLVAKTGVSIHSSVVEFDVGDVLS